MGNKTLRKEFSHSSNLFWAFNISFIFSSIFIVIFSSSKELYPNCAITFLIAPKLKIFLFSSSVKYSFKESICLSKYFF